MKSSFINLESKRNNTTKCEQIIIDLSFVDNRQMKDKEVQGYTRTLIHTHTHAQAYGYGIHLFISHIFEWKTGHLASYSPRGIRCRIKSVRIRLLYDYSTLQTLFIRHFFWLVDVFLSNHNLCIYLFGFFFFSKLVSFAYSKCTNHTKNINLYKHAFVFTWVFIYLFIYFVHSFVRFIFVI